MNYGFIIINDSLPTEDFLNANIANFQESSGETSSRNFDILWDCQCWFCCRWRGYGGGGGDGSSKLLGKLKGNSSDGGGSGENTGGGGGAIGSVRKVKRAATAILRQLIAIVFDRAIVAASNVNVVACLRQRCWD